MKKKTKKYKTYKVIRNKMKITSYNQFRKLASSRFGIKPYTVDICIVVFAIITIAQLIDSILGIIRFFI